jgi:hypothetical protein
MDQMIEDWAAVAEQNENSDNPDDAMGDRPLAKDDPDNATEDETQEAPLEAPEAPQGARPKRGRGRPAQKKKDEETANILKDYHQMLQENQKLKTELDTLKGEKTQLTTRITSFSKELQCVEEDRDIIKSQLIEKEQDYQELLEQVSLQEDKANKVAKPTGIAIVDDITEPLANKLPPKFNWTIQKHRACDITTTEEIMCADVLLFITGVEDIAEGKTGYQTFNTLKATIEKISETTMVFCMCLPPNKNLAVQIDLLNHKLCHLETDNPQIHIIKVRTTGARAAWLEEDGTTPSTKCNSIMKL